MTDLPELTSAAWEDYAARFASEAKQFGHDDAYIEACLNYAGPLINKGLPVIFDTVHFCNLVGYSSAYILAAANQPSLYYREFSIPKRNGDERLISEPLPSLKEIQRWILENILNHLPINPAAKAYVKGRSIRHAARFHRGQSILVSLDIKDFFPSIRRRRVNGLFLSLGYTTAVAKLLTELCMFRRGLPQGAPTSPALSNVLMAPIDARILGFCQKHKIRYTRYADDLSFSGNIKIPFLLKFIERVLEENTFKLNMSKKESKGKANVNLLQELL